MNFNNFNIRKRFLSFLLAAVMILATLPLGNGSLLAEEILSLNVNEPFYSSLSFTADGSTVKSNSYRIPAMVTLDDGTIVAASDIRWNTTYDGGGLDTIVARSTDGGVSWSYVVANYLGDNGNTYNGSSSTCFIDPCLTVAKDGKTVYMLVDLYPYGVALNGSKDTTPSTAVGFTSEGYLKLSNNNHSSYNYYLKDGLIYSNSGTPQDGYTVDDYFNLYYNGTKTSNLFYSTSPFKVVRTGYLYLTKSTDKGASWSAPTLLNLKTNSEQVCLVGPGRGITTSNGTMVFPVYSYGGTTESQRVGFVYSTDGGNTWQRAQSSVSWSSEAAVVEIGTGTLRFFYRNSSAKLCYVDYNLSSSSWGSVVNTGVNTNSNTQMSAITYSKTVDGKQVVLVSCPTGPYAAGSSNNDGSCRINGRIFTGLVNNDGTMSWTEAINVTGTSSATLSGTNYTDAQGFFAYSCLTERADGSIAILYENNQYGWGAGDDKYYTITMKAYSASDLGLTFDDGTGGGTPDPTPENPDNEYELTLGLGQSTKVTVSEIETIGTAGAFVSSDGNVKYVVEHFDSTSSYQQDADGIDSGSKYLIVCSSNYAVTTSSSSSNAWNTNSLPLTYVSFNGSETDYLWTITETTGGYYIQNPAGQYMTIQTGTVANKNYTVTLSSTPFVCDIVSSGSGYMIFADGTYIGLNNAGGSAYNQTALGWTSSDNTVWSLYQYVQQSGTEVEITGLDVTTGTPITIGNTVYNVIVEPIEDNKNIFVMNGSEQTLDAVSDLGLTGTGYTVSYEVTSDESGVITLEGATITAHESNNGSATVTATVKNSSGEAVGSVVYTVAVSAVVITDTKSVFLPKGGTATIEGLTGEITSTMLDTGIATVAPSEGTLSDEDVVITGVDVGMTSVVVGTVQFVIHVNPGTETTNNSSKYIYIYVDEITNCNVYYAINGGVLHKIEGTGILIDQTYIGGFNIMFFAAPFTGYALTSMGITGTAGDYYSLSNGKNEDGSDSDAWPFDSATQTTIPSSSSDSAWVEGHGFRWCLLEGNMTIEEMRDLFERALAVGADGATTMTKNSTDGINSNISFKAEKLPTLEKTIVKVDRDGEEIEFTENTVLRFGDIITYQFKITTYSDNIKYTDIILSDGDIGYTNPLADGILDASGQNLVYTAEYTINQADSDKYSTGSFVNKAELEFSYKSLYSSGKMEETASASVSCRISGIVYYTWMEGLPEGITADITNYPRPTYQVVQYGNTVTVKEYTGLTVYTIFEGDYAIGTWQFKGWTYEGESVLEGQTLTMPMNENMNFVGIWEYVTPPKYTVVYKWVNAPAGVVLPTDNNEYYENQKYFVDSVYYAGKTIEVNSVKWTFSGWKLEGNVVSGQQTMKTANVVLVGEWSGETLLTSLTITKSGWNSSDPSQCFVFVITDENGFNLRVTVKGNSSTVVDGLRVGAEYTVTEESEWSWRYKYDGYTTDLTNESVTNGAKIRLNASDNEIAFKNKRTTEQWLDGDCWLDNIFRLFR